jgi:hypothetical protein
MVVRRVVCDGCHIPFECESVLEVGVMEASATNGFHENGAHTAILDIAPPAPRRRRLPRPSVPGWLRNPNSHVWRYLSIPAVAAGVIAALLLIQGTGGSTHHSASSAKSSAGAPAKGGGGAKPSHGARVVKGSSYTVALPAGWERTEPTNGATFAAASSDSGANATLWIQRDPSLSFPKFESRSLVQLHQLAGSAHVINRVAGPTPESTVVKLAADSPPGQPGYEVTLRVAGPYRYYLATTVDANASRDATDGADLIHNSFVPQPSRKGG